MANAFIAISDDGTAASWNPSGLAPAPQARAVDREHDRRATASPLAGFRTRDDLASFSTAHSSYRNTYLDFASLAVPVTLWGKPVTFQGAWRRLYSLDYREIVSITREPLVPDGPPPVRFDGNSDTLGGVDLVSVAGGREADPAPLARRELQLLARRLGRGPASLSETPLDRAGRLALRERQPDEPRARRELRASA